MVSAALLLIFFVLKSSMDTMMVNRIALAQTYQLPQQSYSNYFYIPYLPALQYSYTEVPASPYSFASPTLDPGYIWPPVTSTSQSSSLLTLLPHDLSITYPIQQQQEQSNNAATVSQDVNCINNQCHITICIDGQCQVSSVDGGTTEGTRISQSSTNTCINGECHSIICINGQCQLY
jgi:hypothetical protein